VTDHAYALEEFVVEAIANLLEDFEGIFEQVSTWANEEGVSVTRDEVVQAIGGAITKGYAQAYLLSEKPPYSQAVEFSPDRLGELWFYITPKGRKLVTELEKR
jgi:hypothetical protein